MKESWTPLSGPNAFEIDNAKALSPEDLAATFVPTEDFWRLLTPKNHVVLGSRGSGKTALVKMLAHQYMSAWDDPRARQTIADRSYIGIYIPMEIEWVGTLSTNQFGSVAEAEQVFQWRLNLASCVRFLDTVRSCLDAYLPDLGSRAQTEERIAFRVGRALFGEGSSFFSLADLHDALGDVALDYPASLIQARVNGVPAKLDRRATTFHLDLFTPLRSMISIVGRELSLPASTTWLVGIDEAELLSPSHHRMINTVLRAASSNMYFKLTTMPYRHYTRETNAEAPLVQGHDFEYIAIDADPVDNEGRNFSMTVFDRRRRHATGPVRNLSLDRLVGRSRLLEPSQGADQDWGPTSFNFALLRRHTNDPTVRRALAILDDRQQPVLTDASRDQLIRKLRGALMLRDAVADATGRKGMDIYSGSAVVIRCADGNPRRLIRIYKALLAELPKPSAIASRRRGPIIPRPTQNSVLTAFSRQTLEEIQAEGPRGEQLYQLIDTVGRYLQNLMHGKAIGTDTVTSVKVDRGTPKEVVLLLREACGIGMFYANVTPDNPDPQPRDDAVYHLAYVLAPHFKLLPRRGRHRSLASIVASRRPSFDLTSDNQLRLFEDPPYIEAT